MRCEYYSAMDNNYVTCTKYKQMPTVAWIFEISTISCGFASYLGVKQVDGLPRAPHLTGFVRVERAVEQKWRVTPSSDDVVEAQFFEFVFLRFL